MHQSLHYKDLVRPALGLVAAHRISYTIIFTSTIIDSVYSIIMGQIQRSSYSL